MENWALPDDTDATTGTVDSNLADSIQLFWNFQALESIGLVGNLASTDNPQPEPAETNEMSVDDFQKEVDKLFLQSFAMQHQSNPLPEQDTNPSPTIESSFPSAIDPIPEQPRPFMMLSNSPEKEHLDDRPQIKLRLTMGGNEPQSETRSLPNPVYPGRAPPRKFANNLPEKPQLRLHISRDDLDRCEQLDPMVHELGVPHLRYLTANILQSLRYPISIDELPDVNIDDPLEGDSDQVLPREAMDILTVMVLGESGETSGVHTPRSQVCNGDLVALQRMILATLRSKNIVIHGTTSARPCTVTQHAAESSLNEQLVGVDLSQVRYEPPKTATRLFVRLYRYILNMLLSTPDCWPFIQPVPEAAVIYHQEIKNPMDLSTIERNIWDGKYTRFSKFEKDMKLIWKNARTFHRNTGSISKHADNLEKLFYKLILDMKKQMRKTHNAELRFDTSSILPEESDLTYPPLKQVFSKQSIVYTISAISPLEPKSRKPKGLTREKLLYLQLNGSFFQTVEQMRSDPLGNHSIVPRFYIAKNRTLLKQVRSHGVLAIFFNTTTKKREKRLFVETSMILAYPASELFDIDQMSTCTDDFAPKGWIHLRPLKIVDTVQFEVNETIDRDHFRRMFTTSKLSVDEKNIDMDTRWLLKRMIETILELPKDDTKDTFMASTRVNDADKKQKRIFSPNAKDIPIVSIASGDGSLSSPKASTTPSDHSTLTAGKTNSSKGKSGAAQSESNSSRLGFPENTHNVWRKLFTVCRSKGADITNIREKYSHLNWNNPNSEGFFKQVYFADDVVVQTFRQMTMYQRVTEVACLIKLKTLPHMAQLREVLYNDNGDIAGLSMERYQTTLKQYTHVHSHHRLSCHQKYEIIHQMLVCMKTIHEAGLAHRDLSEVNIMVNVTDGHLEDGSSNICLYLIDFGKAVFCRETDVRNWFVDIPRASCEYDGDVVPETKEELDVWCESLPWIKGKPDHGYRMYRSIQTLPKTRSDTQVLPWLIHPQSEDIYSIGVMIWKVFAETEPWRGILDTDLQGLRYVAEDDYRIQRALESEVHGELSRQLLLKCLKTRPQDRATASEILDWFIRDDIRAGLLGEWKMYSSETRATRKAKTLYGFDDTDEDERQRKSRKSPQTAGGSGRGRGRPRKQQFQPSLAVSMSPQAHPRAEMQQTDPASVLARPLASAVAPTTAMTAATSTATTTMI